MSKPTASAAGGAMPAEGHKSRRALLRLFGSPALAILRAAGSALALASTSPLSIPPHCSPWGPQHRPPTGNSKPRSTRSNRPKRPSSTKSRTARKSRRRTSCQTLAGLTFKARYAATHYEDNYDEDVMISIVDDLLEMAEEGEGFAEA
jgi:hypothetical protein